MRLTLFIILIQLTQAAIFGQFTTMVDSLVTEADVFMEKKEHQKALDIYNKAYRADPDNPDAITGKVNALLLLEESKEAQKFIDDKLKNQPDKSYLLYSKGLIFNAKEQYKKAVKVLQEALIAQPGIYQDKMYLARGLANMKMRNFTDAIDDFTLTLEIDNRNINALYNRGYCYYQLENYQEAIEDFTRVTELSENNSYALYNTGMAYYRMEQNLNACKYFQQACQLGNTNACKMIITDCANYK